jgi:hypothetical protein
VLRVLYQYVIDNTFKCYESCLNIESFTLDILERLDILEIIDVFGMMPKKTFVDID